MLILLLQGGSVFLLCLFALALVTTRGSIGWWMMQSLPLLLILPWLHTRRRRPLQWLGFVVLFYFTGGVLQLFGPLPLQRWLGGLTVFGCCLLFCTAIVRLRLMNRPGD